MPNQFTVSLWGDEAFSAILSMKSIPEIITISAADTHPPLFNLLEHFWFLIFGTSEVSIRSLTFLLLALATFFVYKIGSRLWDRKSGFFAAALTLTNPFLFTFGFEGRMYSLLVATTAASFYFFIKKAFVGYVLASAAALYTQHFAAFALLSQSLWLLTKRRSWLLKAFLTIGLLYLPWLFPLYQQVTRVSQGFWLGRPALNDLALLVLKYVSFGLIGLVLAPWTSLLKKNPFLVTWFLFPILLAFVISQRFTPIFYDRYLIYTIPAAMLILASNTRKFAIVILSLTILLFAIIDFNYFTHPTKRPFATLASYVASSRQDTDFLINWNAAAHHLWEAKYYQIPAPLFIAEGSSLPFYVGTALMTPDDIVSSIPPGATRVGVITSGPIAEVILPGYTEKEIHVFGDLKFIWFLK